MAPRKPTTTPRAKAAPKVVPEAHTVTVMCSECGVLIELKDVHAWVLSQHLQNACPGTAKLTTTAE